MRKVTKNLGIFVVLGLFVVTVSGCDMVNTVKEYFSKSKKPVANPAATQSPVEAKNVKPVPENLIATVGSWTITKDEFEDRLKALKEVIPDFDTNDLEARKQVLEELVRQQLLVEDAVRTGLAKDKDITSAVEEFRRTLIVREIAQKLTQNISATDEEVRAFYEEKKDILVEAAEWHVREIKVDTKLKASEVLTEILKGADFAETAKINSKADNASSGGDMGFITDVPFPQMASALLPLKVGEVSTVFEGPDGFYIVKLDEKKGGTQIPFEKIKGDIEKNRTLFKQQQAILDYITKLQQEINVEINENNIE